MSDLHSFVDGSNMYGDYQIACEKGATVLLWLLTQKARFWGVKSGLGFAIRVLQLGYGVKTLAR